jgi:ABC-2 type transport system permease protein
MDLICIPALCLSLWAGNWLGVGLFGNVQRHAQATERVLTVDPTILFPGLINAAALMFAVSGYTMWISAGGRFRGRVMGAAILITLVQFLINVIGQMWDAVAPLRPFTVFYYYQPQQIILKNSWSVDITKPLHLPWPMSVNVIAVLAAVGLTGYLLAWRQFRRRDLPAPL